MKILSVFGTRPEAIKFAPVIKQLEKDSRFKSVVAVTGQHREMLDQVLDLFEIKPDYDLSIMAKSQNPAEVAAKVISGLTQILIKEKPDMLLVQGDTNSAFASALASFYLQIPVGHIEAGLRTGDTSAPFPEEANRTMTSRLASLHFAPTQLNHQNLIKENISPENIVVCGNTVIDALFLARDKCMTRTQEYWQNKLPSIYNVVSGKKRIILVTGHRRESFGQGFLNITKAIKTIANRNPYVEIIYPAHLNPNVQKPVKKRLSNLPNFLLANPVDYESFVYLMHKAFIILTDSGGIQEEAPSLGKPVLVMRDKTEREEGIKAGTARLVGVNADKIVKEAERLLKDVEHYQKMSKAHNPYGDGKATKKIIKALINFKND